MLSDISTKITEEVINGKALRNMMKCEYFDCISDDGWKISHDNKSYDKLFHECTKRIAMDDSDNEINKIFSNIEEISKLDKRLTNRFIDDIWFSFENMTLEGRQIESKHLSDIFKNIQANLF